MAERRVPKEVFQDLRRCLAERVVLTRSESQHTDELAALIDELVQARVRVALAGHRRNYHETGSAQEQGQE